MIDKFIDSLARLLFQIAVIATALMLVVVSANVIARFIFNEPLFWSEEVTAIMIVFVTVFPAALLWRRDWHIKLDIFAGKENTTLYQIKQLFVSLSTIVFSGVLAWQTAEATFLVYVQDMREPSLLGAPLWISYSALLIGSVVLLLAGLYSLNATAQRLQKLRR
jgi:TRAP-type C4-dicarboxylate transport system permease small subunit